MIGQIRLSGFGLGSKSNIIFLRILYNKIIVLFPNLLYKGSGKNHSPVAQAQQASYVAALISNEVQVFLVRRAAQVCLNSSFGTSNRKRWVRAGLD